MQISDVQDGLAARLAKRKTAATNPFGELMDPVADKLYKLYLFDFINHTQFSHMNNRDYPGQRYDYSKRLGFKSTPC